jgi:tRNA A-37 threonylcarbamoyl transferase component Bud32
MDYR